MQNCSMYFDFVDGVVAGFFGLMLECPFLNFAVVSTRLRSPLVEHDWLIALINPFRSDDGTWRGRVCK